MVQYCSLMSKKHQLKLSLDSISWPSYSETRLTSTVEVFLFIRRFRNDFEAVLDKYPFQGFDENFYDKKNLEIITNSVAIVESFVQTASKNLMPIKGIWYLYEEAI